MIKTEHKLCSPLTASIRVTNSVLASVSVLVRNQTPTASGAFITGPWRGVFWDEQAMMLQVMKAAQRPVRRRHVACSNMR